MHKAKAIKTVYTGLSLLDLGFSGRIRKKYGFFDDIYFNGISMIFRKESSFNRKPVKRNYRNIYNYNYNYAFYFYNSLAGDRDFPGAMPLSGQNGESRGFSRDLGGPGLEYINRWYLSLQRFTNPGAAAAWRGYEAYPSAGKDEWFWLVQNMAMAEVLPGPGEGQAVEPWGGDESGETRVVFPSGIKPKPVGSITPDETSRIFSRGLRRVNSGRPNHDQQTTSAILNISRNLHTQFMNYRTGKQFADYEVTLLENAERRPEGRDHGQPGYLKGNGSGARLIGYKRWLDWYQSRYLKRIKRAEEEISFERQVLENYRHRLTIRLKHLNREINQSIQKEPEPGERSTARVGSRSVRFSYGQEWLRERRWLKLELERISELPASQGKSSAGGTPSPGEQEPSRSTPEGSGPGRRPGEDFVTDTITIQTPGLTGPGDTRREGNNPGQPVSGAVDKIPETAGALIGGRAYDMLAHGTVTDMVYLKKLKYNQLLNEIRGQETAIWIKQQQLLRLIEINDQTNLPGMRFNSAGEVSSATKRSYRSRRPGNAGVESIYPPLNPAAMISKKLDAYRQTLILGDKLSQMQELIKYRTEYEAGVRRERSHEPGTRVPADKEAESPAGVYGFQKQSAGDLRINKQWKETQHIISSLSRRNIFAVIGRRQLTPGYLAINNARQPKEIRRRDEILKEIEAGRSEWGKEPADKGISPAPRGVYFYAKPRGVKEEGEWREIRIRKQEHSLDYVYNFKRLTQLSTTRLKEIKRELPTGLSHPGLRAGVEKGTPAPRGLQELPGQTTGESSITGLYPDRGPSPPAGQHRRTSVPSRFIAETIERRQLMQGYQGIRPAAVSTGMTTNNNMFFINAKGRFEPGQKLSELSILHRSMTGIGAGAGEPEDFSKYSQMEFHRQVKEPDAEPITTETQNEAAINSQVFNYAGEIKIDQANMERIVNNVYNEIERRLEFERERRGL